MSHAHCFPIHVCVCACAYVCVVCVCICVRMRVCVRVCVCVCVSLPLHTCTFCPRASLLSNASLSPPHCCCRRVVKLHNEVSFYDSRISPSPELNCKYVTHPSLSSDKPTLFLSFEFPFFFFFLVHPLSHPNIPDLSYAPGFV